MCKLMFLVFVLFVYLNINDVIGQQLQCLSCRSRNAEGCDTKNAEPSKCPKEYPYCIAMVGVTKSKETIYFRSCFRGDCDAERKSEPDVTLKQCKACNTSLCNNDSFKP